MSRGESPTTWTTVLLVLMLAGPPRLVARDPSASLRGDLSWAVLLNVLVWALAALWVFNEMNGYLIARKEPIGWSWVEKGALLFPLSIVPSVIVSVSPAFSGYRAAQVFIGMLFGMMWVRRFGYESLIWISQRTMLALCGIAIAGSLVAPSLFIFGGRVLGGAFVSVSSVATLAFAGAIALGGRMSPGERWSTIAVSVGLVVASQTRTAYASLFAVLLIAVALSAGLSRSRRAALLALAAVPIVALAGWGERVLGFLIRDTVSFRTISDRLPLWGGLLAYTWANNPLFGIGYVASRALTLQVNARIGGAHSVFVEVFTGSGVVGLAGLFAAAGTLVVGTVQAVRQAADREWPTLVAMWLAALAIHALFSEEMLYSTTSAMIWWVTPGLLAGMLGLHAATSTLLPAGDEQ